MANKNWRKTTPDKYLRYVQNKIDNWARGKEKSRLAKVEYHKILKDSEIQKNRNEEYSKMQKEHYLRSYKNNNISHIDWERWYKEEKNK